MGVWLFYKYRFNAALARLGVPASMLPPHLVSIANEGGRRHRCTPQEAALMVVSSLTDGRKQRAMPHTAAQWIRAGKVDTTNDAIKWALSDLGWADLTDRN